MTHNVFTKLYQSLVEPVMYYSAAIWGIGNAELKKIQIVQNKACRYFLGGGKYASNVALRGDMGWVSAGVNAKVDAFGMYLKLDRLPPSRLTQQVHWWSKNVNRSWESRVLSMASKHGCLDILNDNSKCVKAVVSELKQTLSITDATQLKMELDKSDKLRTYKQYKCDLQVEHYSTLSLSRDHRRTLFRFRSCSLPLFVETGRYNRPKVPLGERICKLCSLNKVEDEVHFLIDCSLYSDYRYDLFMKASVLNDAFVDMPSIDKMKFIMNCNELQRLLANNLTNMYKRRNVFT